MENKVKYIMNYGMDNPCDPLVWVAWMDEDGNLHNERWSSEELEGVMNEIEERREGK